MHDGDRKERADGLQDKTHPFGEIDLGLADLDALAARFQGIFERGHDLALGDLLTWTTWRQCEGLLERLGERCRADAQRRGLAGHHRPFLRRGFLNVTPDEACEMRVRLARK